MNMEHKLLKYSTRYKADMVCFKDEFQQMPSPMAQLIKMLIRTKKHMDRTSGLLNESSNKYTTHLASGYNCKKYLVHWKVSSVFNFNTSPSHPSFAEKNKECNELRCKITSNICVLTKLEMNVLKIAYILPGIICLYGLLNVVNR
jgi:hypothetical protein